jgi:hypothetical protein
MKLGDFFGRKTFNFEYIAPALKKTLALSDNKDHKPKQMFKLTKVINVCTYQMSNL